MLIDIIYLSNEKMMSSIPMWASELIDVFFKGYPINMNILKRKDINIYTIDDISYDEESGYTKIMRNTGEKLLTTSSASEITSKINLMLYGKNKNGSNGNTGNTDDSPGNDERGK